MAGFVYVVYHETMTLRIPLAATDRHRCPQARTPTKWTSEAIEGVLTFFKEVQLPCLPAPSGGGSLPNCKGNSSRTSPPS